MFRRNISGTTTKLNLIRKEVMYNIDFNLSFSNQLQYIIYRENSSWLLLLLLSVTFTNANKFSKQNHQIKRMRLSYTSEYAVMEKLFTTGK